MPSKLVSKCGCLLSIITKISLLFAKLGHFLDDWKEALVFLLLKETAADLTFKNLRPVSNLLFISKLTENAAFNQTYLIQTNFPPFHSTYRKNHSTETAIIKITI